ncbi:MAG: DNA polymerase III subunit gamma/tau C-terminal domain-containing protein [Thiolinea sp.]
MVSTPEPPATPAQNPEERTADNEPVQSVVTEEPVVLAETVISEPAAVEPVDSQPVANPVISDLPVVPEVPVDAGLSVSEVAAGGSESDVEPDSAENPTDNVWHDMLLKLKLSGMAKQLAEHCLFKSQVDDNITLTLDTSGETLKTTRTEEALHEALCAYFSKPVRLEFEASAVIGETPEKRRIRLRKERQLAAEQSIAEDPVIRELQQKWGGIVLPGSVKPNKDVDTS